MELYVYSRDMTLQGIVEKISSLIWTRRYWSCGEFKLLVPFTEEHARLLVKENIIIKRGGNEAAEIRYIHITKNSQGMEEIEVQGKFLLSWIGKRILTTQIITKDTTQNILSNACLTHAQRTVCVTQRAPCVNCAMKGDAMKNEPSSGKRVAKRRFFKADERFATKAVIVIAITTAAFIVAQYVSFLITRQEQTVLIEWYFRAVVIECGAMMMKRLAEVIVGRIKKKEKIDITESEDTNNDY